MSRSKINHVMPLTRNGVTELMKPVSGKGGFQNFARKLQGQINGRTIGLTDEDLGKVIRYAHYDKGGFEGRLARALGGQIVRAAAGTFVL